ncbi:Sterigmatocystin 8-O-methyltransferase [Talaromyces islandicus]|uniref:Sterigmatocystin 8-O-methyltransferase n=1 Tax=Talaromyces islandicus TaxID=28573 RepID=A0A0U1LLE6_TALIS|nr:Sterigmatocystin 8-O-methyltransferase [Talaromyces islandicus]
MDESGANSSLVGLAEQITKNAKALDEYIVKNRLPKPTFASDGPLSFPIPQDNHEMQAVRLALIGASRSLLELALGPLQRLNIEVPTSFQFASALGVANHFHIAEHVPTELSSEISFEDLSAKVGLDVNRLKRIIRVNTANRVFMEPHVGYIAHTAASKVMLDPDASAWIGHQMEEIYKGSARVIDSFHKYEHSNDVNETALALALDCGTYWDYLEREPWKVQRFADALRYVSSHGREDICHVIETFDWSKFGKTTVVDVGGSSGRVAIEIAKVAPNLNFIVQDLPELSSTAKKMIMSKEPQLENSNRVIFQAHDFFQPQPVRNDATVYMYRQILHDWPDKDAISILKALVPALNDGDTLLLFEAIQPLPNTVPNEIERLIRAADYLMMQKHNSPERTLDMWKNVLARADPRFDYVSHYTPSGSNDGMIEVRWNETRK